MGQKGRRLALGVTICCNESSAREHGITDILGVEHGEMIEAHNDVFVESIDYINFSCIR